MFKRNLFLYYAILSFNNFWFVTTNWVNYWLKFMSLPDVGLVDSLAFLVGILIEIPSGIFSDKLGRKISLLVANLFQFMGTFLITLADNRFEIAFGFIIFQIGVSLFSGSIEALGFESCENDDQYQKVVQKSVFWSNICYLFAVVVGGYLYTFKPEFVNFLWSLNYLISMFFCVFICDLPSTSPQVVSSDTNPEPTSRKFRIKDFLDLDLNFALILLALSAISFIFDYGFLKISVLDEFSSIQDNYLYLFIITSALMIVNYLQFKFFPPKDYLILKFLSFISIIFLVIPFLNQSLVILTFWFLTYLTLILPQISLIYINTRVSDEIRASAISLFNFIWKLPYVFLAPLLAYTIQYQGLPFSLSVLVFLLPIFLIFGHIFRKIYYNYVVTSGA